LNRLIVAQSPARSGPCCDKELTFSAKGFILLISPRGASSAGQVLLLAWPQPKNSLSQQRGPKSEPHNPLADEVERLRRENQQLTHRLKQAETIIEFQKKVSEILGLPLREPGEAS
jgi:hypothetical protein